MPIESFQGHLVANSNDISLPPRAKVSIPGLAIGLTNRAIRAAYPDFYGKGIPILRENDVRVVTKEGINQFSQEVTRKVFYPATLVYDQARAEHSSSSLQPVVSSFMTLWDYPGKPILVLDSYLEELRPLGNLVLSEVLAAMLIHENLHRVPKIVDVALKPEDPLFKTVAFSTQMTQVYLIPEGEPRQFALEKLNELTSHIATRPAMLRLFGGLAMVYGLDEADGKMKRVADNGYDANEALVELLSEPPRIQLMKEIAKNHNPKIAEDINSSIRAGQGKDSSINIQQYTPEMIRGFCRDLGLSSIPAIFQGYLNSRFATSHNQLRPTVVYPT